MTGKTISHFVLSLMWRRRALGLLAEIQGKLKKKRLASA
jgi:hypothetical protein